MKKLFEILKKPVVWVSLLVGLIVTGIIGLVLGLKK